MGEDIAFTIEGDSDTAELTVPGDLLAALGEPDQTAAETLADIAQMSATSRAHMLVHHDEEATDPEIEAAEQRARELFEQRFGMTYAEATGHSH